LVQKGRIDMYYIRKRAVHAIMLIALALTTASLGERVGNAAVGPTILALAVEGNSLVIAGSGFPSTKLTVTIAGTTVLGVLEHTPTTIVAALPAGGLPQGSYLVQLAFRGGASASAFLTIGAAAGATGPTLNLQKVAMLQWYNAADIPNTFSAGGAIN
jgi:hypothetical protein